MPVTFERDDQRRRVTITAVGAVSLEDALRVLERQAAFLEDLTRLCGEAIAANPDPQDEE